MSRTSPRLRALRPKQRDGFGEIADIIVGHIEQCRIDALADQRADQSGFGMLKAERAGKRRQRITTFRIGRRAEVICHQPQLVIARRLE